MTVIQGLELDVRDFGSASEIFMGHDDGRDTTALQQACAEAGGIISNAGGGVDQGGCVGHLVRLPKGTGIFTDTVMIPFGVTVRGPNTQAAVLKMHPDFAVNKHMILQGDPNAQIACMDARLEDCYIYAPNLNANVGMSAVYSNNNQHRAMLRNVKIYSGNRSSIAYDIGHGGASYIKMEHVEVNNVGAHGGSNLNKIVRINVGGGTRVSIDDIVVQGPSDGSGGTSHVGIQCDGGMISIDGFHTENVYFGINNNLIGSYATKGILRVKNATGGNQVRAVVRLQAPFNTPQGITQGVTLLEGIQPNGPNVFSVLTEDQPLGSNHGATPNYQGWIIVPTLY